jgi:hypothetical protein
MKHLAAILVGVAAGIAFAATAHAASAHDAAVFYPHRWSPASVTYAYTPSVPTGEWRTSIDSAAVTWSNVNGSTFDYIRGTDFGADFDPTDPCGHQGQNGIHTRPGASGGVLGTTFTCWSGSGAQPLTSMQVRFDSSDNFYTGSGTPGSSQSDLRSVATHELGHATGFTGHITDSSLCQFNSTQQTMCTTHLAGSTWQRTLELHDEHTFTAAYPGPVTTTTTAGGTTSTTGGGTTTTRPCSKGCSTSTTGGATSTTTGGSTTTAGPTTTSCGKTCSTTTLPGGSTTTRPPK